MLAKREEERRIREEEKNLRDKAKLEKDAAILIQREREAELKVQRDIEKAEQLLAKELKKD